MSQHDYIISDATGSAFLSDLNLAVKALAENNSGATEPAVMYAHMWWADTTNDILKKRNATNTGWISYLTLSTGALIGNSATATTAGTSGTFTITGNGFTVNPTATATWKKNNNVVSLSIPIGSITGTSNATNFILSGLPAAITPAANIILPICHGFDNSANFVLIRPMVTSVSTIDLSIYTTGTLWTASGTKSIYQTEFTWMV